MWLFAAATTLLAACIGGPADPLGRLLDAVPADLSGRGVHLQRGATGSELLLQTLGVSPEQVRATATMGAPSVRVLLGVTDTSLEQRLTTSGFTPTEAAEGWSVLRRGEESTGFTGIPAVAVGRSSAGDAVVAIGDVGELELIAEAEAPLRLADGTLRGASAAFVAQVLHPEGGGTQATTVVPGTAPLPPHDLVAVTADMEPPGSGRVVLQLAGEGTQADAVALAVRIRTSGPLDGEGVPLWHTGGSLTTGNQVVAGIKWVGDPGQTLPAAATGGLLDFLNG